jgi:tetratricopeptide (TPR) repeat protein
MSAPTAIERDLEQAAALFEAGRLPAAAQIYQRLERSGDLRAIYGLAVIDIRQGRLDRARRRLETLTAKAPGHVAAQHNLGTVRQQLGDWAGAAAAYEQALALRPEVAETRQALAIALTVLGRTQDAVAHYRELARSPATRWPALTRMALIDAGAITDEDLQAMQGATVAPGLDLDTRTGLCFALGEALERRGEVKAAFEAFAQGNRLKRGALDAPSAAEAHEAAVREIEQVFTPAFLAAHAGKGTASAAPIFIVGFPRSGSTLVEQILGSHPDVQAMGETGLLGALSPDALPRLPLRKLADQYLEAIRGRGWTGAPRFVDKTLENYLHVGLIHLAFPRATILHAVRDPVETGFSCFRQLFASGNETLYDLADIGAEYRRHRRVMAHWERVLPGRVVEIGHEALVADPEGGARALLAAAGLAWDPSVLRFFERQGAVRTASASQVRRPITAEAVGRWRRYAAELEPLIEALGEGEAPRGASDGT